MELELVACGTVEQTKQMAPVNGKGLRTLSSEEAEIK